MYAIRSYYAFESNGIRALNLMSSPGRITSYNVCYTKLLRAVIVLVIVLGAVIVAVESAHSPDSSSRPPG